MRPLLLPISPLLASAFFLRRIFIQTPAIYLFLKITDDALQPEKATGKIVSCITYQMPVTTKVTG
jgi:hypothetical protein